jgi:hypothetical protein
MKQDFEIKTIDKKIASSVLLKYHYLKDISKGFKSGFNYGLFKNGECVGVIIFTNFPVPELAIGLFGLKRNEQDGLFELSRLCLTPNVQQDEHNLASWFVSKAIKSLRKQTLVKAILSYADADFHSGIVYKACNFKYYGLSAPKKDFWIKQDDGSFVKHSRGRVKGLDGEWRSRSRKHKFLLVYDKSLKVRWKEVLTHV